MNNQTRTTENGSKILRRYTNLAATIHHLNTKTITLLDPKSWDDKNDTFFLDQYKCKKQAKSVLALCFSLAPQTYHHWKIFSGGGDGVCIEFDKEKLLESIDSNGRCKHREVNYKKIGDIQSQKPGDDELPFLKREPYKDEQEYRIIFVDMNQKVEFKSVDIQLDSIRRITLSPWMPEALAKSVKGTLKEIDDCGSLEIYPSKLIEYEKWKNAVK